MAARAGVGDYLSGAMALGAGLLQGEKTLLHAHLPVAVAGRADLGLRAGLGSRALAGLAVFLGGNADLGFGPASSLLQGDFQVVAQVGAPIDAVAPAASRGLTEDVAEDVAEGVGEGGSAAPASAHGRIDPCMAVLVIGRALLRLGEDLVGLLGFLE